MAAKKKRAPSDLDVVAALLAAVPTLPDSAVRAPFVARWSAPNASTKACLSMSRDALAAER